MREAQFGLIVIGLLLCVLVYVAFYRLTGRSSRYDQIARDIPVAESIGGAPYQAQRVYQTDRRLETRIGAPHKGGLRSALQQFATASESPVPKPLAPESSDNGVAQATYMPPVTTSDNILKTSGELDRSLFVPAPNTAAEVKHAFEVPQRQPSVPVLKSNFGRKPSRKPDSGFQPLLARAKKKASTKVTQLIPGTHVESLSWPETKQPDAKPSDVEFPPHSESKMEPSVERKMEPETALGSTSVGESSLKIFSATPATKRVPQRITGQTAGNASHPIPTNGNRTYATRAGDSLWTIALNEYGDGRYFRALHAFNRETFAQSDALTTGTVLNMASIEELKQAWPDLCPADPPLADLSDTVRPATGERAPPTDELRDAEIDRRFYRTRDGDTLFGIARQRLGQASRYLEIHELNRYRVPETANHLTPLGGGIELLLPE